MNVSILETQETEAQKVKSLPEPQSPGSPLPRGSAAQRKGQDTPLTQSCCLPVPTRHCNMVLENVKEMWTEVPKTARARRSPSQSTRTAVSKMFLRWDSPVIAS